jgi:hypothetical protein
MSSDLIRGWKPFRVKKMRLVSKKKPDQALSFLTFSVRIMR